MIIDKTEQRGEAVLLLTLLRCVFEGETVRTGARSGNALADLQATEWEGWNNTAYHALEDAGFYERKTHAGSLAAIDQAIAALEGKPTP